MPLLRDYIDVVLKTANKTSFETFSINFYNDVCGLKRNFLVENYLLIFFSLPLTIFLYLWNSFNLELKNKRKKKEKRSSKQPESQTNLSSSDSDEDEEDKLRRKKFLDKEKASEANNEDKNCFLKFCSKLRLNFNMELVIPMNPFSKTNRLITCVIYAAYVHNITKIFEFSVIDVDIDRPNKSNSTFISSFVYRLDSFQYLSAYGILLELVIKVLNVFIISFHFYPVLLCVEFKRKSKLSYLLCSIYVWILFIYFVFVAELCKDEQIDIKAIFVRIYGMLKDLIGQFMGDNISQVQNIFQFVKNQSQEMDLKGRIQNISDSQRMNQAKDLLRRSSKTVKIEELIFYIILCVIAVGLTVEYMVITIKQIIKIEKDWFIFRIFKRAKKVTESAEYESDSDYEVQRVKNELNYTTKVFKEQNKQISYLRYVFEKYIYKKNKYFRFSKQFINIQIIAFILLYYCTCFIMRRSEDISYGIGKIFGVFLTLALSLETDKTARITDTIDAEIKDVMLKTCLITSAIYGIQLLFGIKNYQKNVLNAYKGVYNDIPSPSKFSNAKIASGSLHYR